MISEIASSIRANRPLWVFGALFLIITALIQTTITTRLVDELTIRGEEIRYQNLANEFAQKLKPYLAQNSDPGTTKAALMELESSSPGISLYVTDHFGLIKLHTHSSSDVKRLFVDVRPIRSALDGQLHSDSLLGDDPLSFTGRRTFSVAEILFEGKAGYLYAIVAAPLAGSPIAVIAHDAVIKGTIYAFILTLMIAAIAALVMSVWLNQRHKLVRQAVADLSHDIKGPLTSIQGYVETVLRKDKELSPDQKKRFLETALKNATRMYDMTRDLLDCTTLDDIEGKIQLEEISLQDIASDVVARLAPVAYERQVRLIAQPQSGIPSVRGDSRLVERAISNLVENAIRHTPVGGVVSISIKNHGDRLALAVQDTGSGIEEAQIPTLFERFTSKGSKRGARGLGLAIVKKIADLHGGSVLVSTSQGHGSTFALELPLAFPIQ